MFKSSTQSNEKNIFCQVAKSDLLPELGATSSGMSSVQRAQYKSYKELKQRIERERQLAVVQVFCSSRYRFMKCEISEQHRFIKCKISERQWGSEYQASTVFEWMSPTSLDCFILKKDWLRPVSRLL